jgi:hypothetical protein
MHYTMCCVLCHGSQPTVRRDLGLDNPVSREVTFMGVSAGHRKHLGVPRRTEVTEAGGPFILSKVVLVSVVQGVE